MISIKPEWVGNRRASLALSVWHDLVIELSKAQRVMESLGHPKQAAQLSTYTNLFTAHATYHLDRLIGENGHAQEETSPVPPDRRGHDAVTANAVLDNGSPIRINGAAALRDAAVIDQAGGTADPDLMKDIESKLGEVEWEMSYPKFKEAPSLDQQRFEVAQSKLFRARTHLRCGQSKQARRQYDGAVALLIGKESEYAEG